jgi:NitT/TauT family transport system permease protein
MTGAATAARPPSSAGARIKRVVTSNTAARITSYIAFIVFWQILANIVDRLPSPWETADFLWREITGGSHGGVITGEFWEHLLVTIVRFSVGLVFAFLLGVFLGILLGSSPFFRSLLNDVLLVFLALPAVIWAFLTVMWFGLGWEAPVYTVILSATPFVAVNVAQGVRSVSPELHRMSDAFGVPGQRRLRHLLLPAVNGYLFTGLRFAVIIGWNAVLLAEWFGAANGVGWRSRFWYDAARYRGFVGWVIIFITFIFLVDGLVLRRLERHAFRWRKSGRGPSWAETEEATITGA